MDYALHTAGPAPTVDAHLEKIMKPMNQIVEVLGNARSTMSTAENEVLWPHVIEILSCAENGTRPLLTSTVLVFLQNQEWKYTTKVTLAKFINNIEQICDTLEDPNLKLKALALSRAIATMYANAASAAHSSDGEESATMVGSDNESENDTTSTEQTNKSEKVVARGGPAHSDCDSGNKSDDESGESDFGNKSEDCTATIEETKKPEKVRIITRGGPADSDRESSEADFDKAFKDGMATIEETNEKVLTCGSLADVDSDSDSESDKESVSTWCDVDNEQHMSTDVEALDTDDTLSDWVHVHDSAEYTPESGSDSGEFTPESESDSVEYYLM